MCALAQFQPAQGPGAIVNAGLAGLEAGSSLMQRAEQMRRQREMDEQARQQFEMEKVKFAIQRPVLEAAARADVVSTNASVDTATQMQNLRLRASEVAPTANEEFIGATAIPDWNEQARALSILQSKYAWLLNARDDKGNQLYKGFLDVIDEARANAVIRAKTDAALEGLTPEEKTKARRVDLGIEPRVSGAAIQYREVMGDDGRLRLVALDPRAVGAHVVGSGETYGSGVGPVPVSQPQSTREEPSRANPFKGLTPFEKKAAEEEAQYKAQLQKEQPKRRAALRQAEVSTQRLTEDLEELVNEVSSLTAGPGGTLLEKFPGTTAKDLAANLESIKARIGFAALQAMREASPTGGALGNVTERENTLTQSTLGSLDIGQSPSQLIRNIKRVQKRLNESLGIIRGTYEDEYGQQKQEYKLSPEAEEALKLYQK